MSTFNLGSEVVYQGLRMKVVDGVYNGAITLVDLNDASAMCQVPVQDVILAPHVAKPLTQFDLAEWHGLERLGGAAREIIAAPTAQDRKVCYEKYVLALGCCKRTLERTVKKIMAFDSIRALAAQKSGRPIGTRYLDAPVETVICEQLNQNWLVGNQPLLSDVIDQIQSECRKRGLSEPCATTIRRRAMSLDAYRVMALREGAKKAKYTLAAMPGHIDAALALETVQIDHTLADVILVSERNRTIPIGRPWVTLAIDVATRMVVGVYITLEPPSAVSVAMCLVNALVPKGAFLSSLGLKGSWPVSGVMQCIHLDNAREFHSEALQRGCGELAIDIQYRPVGSPHYGGIIERLIGTFMGRCRLLPGATQSSVAKRGDYDSEAKAAMTLSEFKAFFVNEIVNIYHTKVHWTLNVPPLAKWDQLRAKSEMQPALPAGWNDWMLPTIFYPFEMRLIRRTGAQLENRLYWHDDLEEWIGDKVKRPVFYDPGDLSKVIVRGPTGVPLVAYDTRTNADHLSLAEYKHDRKYDRALGRTPAMLEQFDQGLDTRQDLKGRATKATKTAHRQAAIAKGKQARAGTIPSDTPSKILEPPNEPLQLSFNKSNTYLPVRRKGEIAWMR